MIGLSNYLASKINDFLFGNVSYTPPTIVYIALAIGAVGEGDTGSTFAEANYTGYQRVAITNNVTSFPSAVNGTKTNGVEFRFPTSQGIDNIIQEIVICDALTGGNIIGGGAITTSKTYTVGDRPVFEVGSVTITVA